MVNNERIAATYLANYSHGMSGALVETVKALPLEDRLLLIEELWGTIDEADIPLPAAEEIRLAEERLSEYRANPDAAITLEEIKARYSTNR